MDIWTFLIGIVIGIIVGFTITAMAISAMVEKARCQAYGDAFKNWSDISMEKEKEIMEQVKGDAIKMKELELQLKIKDYDIGMLQRAYDKLEAEMLKELAKPDDGKETKEEDE